MMLLGFLWAAFAPLLIVGSAVMIAFILSKVNAPNQASRTARSIAVTRLLIGGGISTVATLAAWVPERVEFSRFCSELAEPKIHERRSVDGFFLDDSTANSFGMRYIQEEGFAWIEARSIYKRDGFVRYSKLADGRIKEEPIDAPSATVTVKAEHTEPKSSTTVSGLTISDRATGRVIAHGASANFNGGKAMLVLGAYGIASCPSPITASGQRQFQALYHLARDTLRAAN